MGVDGIELPEASLAAMARRTTVFFFGADVGVRAV